MYTFGGKFNFSVFLFETALQSVGDVIRDLDKLSAHMAQHPKLKYTALHIDATKLHVKTFFRTYTKVTQSILEWSDVAIPFFKEYQEEVTDLAYDDGKKISKVNGILSATTLVIGILKMQTSQFELGESKFKFNDALLKIIELELKIRGIFDSEPPKFKEKNREFYRSLESLLRDVEADIGNVKYHLSNEIQAITDLKIIIKNAKGLIALDEHPKHRYAFRSQLIKITKDSLARCDDYRKNHI